MTTTNKTESMNTMHKTEHGVCRHYLHHHNVEFKIVAPQKGEHYIGRDDAHHSIVFMLEGAVEFSYNEYLHSHFSKGDMFFLPQSAEMYGTALEENTRMMVLKFNNRVKSICDNCRLPNFKKEITKIDYTFSPLKITPILSDYLYLMERYLNNTQWCCYLHELKQQELFILFNTQYSKQEMAHLFYPILGANPHFRVRVVECYSKEMNVQEMADEFGMGYSSFLRKFKKEFGESVQEWMQKQKAKHIQLKMSIPSTSIADIVYDYGFSDASHFSRYCRKQFGCTPGELMKKLQKDAIEHSKE